MNQRNLTVVRITQTLIAHNAPFLSTACTKARHKPAVIWIETTIVFVAVNHESFFSCYNRYCDPRASFCFIYNLLILFVIFLIPFRKPATIFREARDVVILGTIFRC
jgi:hypothetical protein